MCQRNYCKELLSTFLGGAYQKMYVLEAAAPRSLEPQRQPPINTGLERKSRLYLKRSWRHEVRPAESRQEVIQRNLIGDVHHGKSQAYLVVIRSEQIVGPGVL